MVCCSGNNSFCSSLFWDFTQDECYSSSYCFCWLRNWNNAEAYQTGNKVVTLHNFEINFSLRWPFLLTSSSSSRYYYELMLQVCHLSHSIPYMNFADLLGKFCVFCKVRASTSTNIWSYNYLEWETTEKKYLHEDPNLKLLELSFLDSKASISFGCVNQQNQQLPGDALWKSWCCFASI